MRVTVFMILQKSRKLIHIDHKCFLSPVSFIVSFQKNYRLEIGERRV